MNPKKVFKAVINSKNMHFTMHEVIPTINDKAQPMELLFVIEDPEKGCSPIVLSFDKSTAEGILKEMKRLVPIVSCFG